MESFDLIILGGGSGGLAAAQRAAEYGARVAVLEPARLGGTCVNVGCVPKKVMWNAANLAHALEYAPDYGFSVRMGGHDWAKLKHGRDAYVRRLNGIYERNLERKQVTTIRSRGTLAGPNEILAASGERYSAPHIVIATGGRPKVPELPGAELGITSDGFFELQDLPKRVAVVGSGYVAVELVGVLQALGSELSLFVRLDGVLRQFDGLITARLAAQMQADGVVLVTGAVPRQVTRDAAGLTLHTADGRAFGGFDALIWAVGRDPNTVNLGLGEVGVALDNAGFVIVDDYQNTNVAGVYAIGDVAGRAELTPVAIAAGRRLAERLFGGQPDRHLRYDLIPSVVFSHPPIGTVGLSEHAALRTFPDEQVRVYKTEFVPMFHALTEAKPLTAMKLVAVGAEERIVGCHVIGPGADEMIQGFAVAVSMGARKVDFDDTLAIHPTSAEEFVTMR